MDFETIFKALRNPFPFLFIALFFVLEKFNQWEDLLALVVLVIFFFMQQYMARYFAPRLNVKRVLKMNKNEQADQFVKKLYPKNKLEFAYMALSMTVNVLLYLYVFTRLTKVDTLAGYVIWLLFVVSVVFNLWGFLKQWFRKSKELVDSYFNQ